MGTSAYRSWVEISLKQIAENFQAVRDVVGPGVEVMPVVMADFLPIERARLIDCNLTPVIHSLGDIREWDRMVGERKVAAPYHLKIDTGMGRLGACASAREILEAIGAAKNSQLEGLMTHFASAANYATSQTDEQIRAFTLVCDQLSR